MDIWFLILVEDSFDSSIGEMSKSGDYILYQIIKRKEDLIFQITTILKSISINIEE